MRATAWLLTATTLGVGCQSSPRDLCDGGTCTTVDASTIETSATDSGGVVDASDADVVGDAGGITKLFGINHLVYCGASEIADAASHHVLADRIGVDPTQDITEWGSPTSTWFNALRVSGVRGWALLNPHTYGDYTTLNLTTWGNGVVSWFKVYGKGGTYWSADAGPDLGPDAVEVLNEPYGSWFWSNVSPTGYFKVVQATRQALDAAGLSWVKVVASGDVARDTTFFDGFATAGGLTVADGIAIHPYGPVQAAGGWTDGWAGEETHYLDQTFEQQLAAAEAWAPSLLVYMTEGGQNQTEPTAQDGDSALVSATYAAAAYAEYAHAGATDPMIAAMLPYAWCDSVYGIYGTPAEDAYGNAIP